MREYDIPLTHELLKGLRPYRNRPRNVGGLLECFNLYSDGEGMVPHQPVISMNEASVSWGAQEFLNVPATTRDYTICIHDYVTDVELENVMIYIDGQLAGQTDVNGELTILGLAIGGHSIKATLAGYVDSDADAILNDYFVVT